jgi:hypothetical protein
MLEMTRLSSIIACACVVTVLDTASTQTPSLTAAAHKTSPPSELAPEIAAQLSSEGVSASISQPSVKIDFWWVKSLPIKAGAGAPSWTDVDEGSLIGAVRLSSEYRDIRGRVLKAGVYTLRYGIQPANGDHLGVSPFRDFLLLSPAAVDKDPAQHGHDGTVELSKQAIGGSHPSVWSIDPPAATEVPLQHHKTELGHDAIIMQVPVTRGGQAAGTLKFGLVLIGKIEA